MKAKINNEKIVEIGSQNIYDICRLLTLAQIENVLCSNFSYVLLYIGDYDNYLFCDPIITKESGEIGKEKTNGYLITFEEFVKEITPRLKGFSKI